MSVCELIEASVESADAVDPLEDVSWSFVLLGASAVMAFGGTRHAMWFREQRKQQES